MITYNNKEFKTRTFRVINEEEGKTEEDVYTIADESLFDAISENEDYLNDELTKEYKIDNEIYFYVEKGQLELSAEEICADCLDTPLKFLEEIF